MKHTWYHYASYGHYEKTTFGKYKVKYTEYWGGRYHYSRAHRVRITYLKGYKGKWINVMGLHQTAGDGEYYKLVHHRGHIALKSAGGAGLWFTGYWYRGHIR